MLQVKEIMNRSIGDLGLERKMTQCTTETTAEEATRMLQASSGGSLVVVTDKKLVGIFTERDVLKKVTLNPADPKQVKMAQVMTPNPVTVKRSTTLGEVLNKMRDGKFRHLVVVDSYGNAEGIISMRDIMDHIANLMVQGLKD